MSALSSRPRCFLTGNGISIAALGSSGAACVMGRTVTTDHAQYLAHWLSVMKEVKKAVFTAASKASEAAAYLTGLQS
jgi:antirestriction protein ArdC